MEEIRLTIRTLYGQPMSQWVYQPHIDVCTWLMTSLPQVEPDLGMLSVLAANGLEVAPGEIISTLQSQFADMQSIQIAGVANWWVKSDDILFARRVPVQLAFSITPSAHEALPYLPRQENGSILFPLANLYPPPNWGEHALVDTGQGTWQLYHLAATGDEGFSLWEQLGNHLKHIAYPMDWMLFDDLIPKAAAAYEMTLAAYETALGTAKGKHRRELREDLARLEAARIQVQAMDTWQRGRVSDILGYSARWMQIRELARRLSELYWAAHQQGVKPDARTSPLSEAERDELTDEEQMQLGILRRIPDPHLEQTLVVPTYQEDRAAREASLVANERWSRENGVHRFRASNNLVVFLGSPDAPIAASEAQTYLAQRSQSTALTARVVLGLWNLRRHDQQLTWKGGAGIRIDEILEWRGYAKLGADKDGNEQYRMEHRELIRRDMRILANYYIKGRHTVRIRGKMSSINVAGQYLMATELTQMTLWNEEETIGYFVTPGDWILSYEEAGNIYLTEVDRRIFELQPHNDQHEICLALYLVERWREQYAHGTYDEPISMLDLLNESVIDIDRRNLTGRFAPRIESALKILQKRGILGDHECLTKIDKTKRNWGAAWLAATWRLRPPMAAGQLAKMLDVPRRE